MCKYNDVNWKSKTKRKINWKPIQLKICSGNSLKISKISGKSAKIALGFPSIPLDIFYVKDEIGGFI